MLSKLPYCFAVLGMVGGVSIAILFGVNEDMFKNKIAEGLTRNSAINQITDPAAKAEVLSEEADKSWRYYQRFHLHSTGIGAMSLSLLIFLSFVQAPRRVRLAGAWLVALGGFLYPFYWLFAAMYGPEIGRSEAKEAFAMFGYMGGLFLVGAVTILICALKYPLRLQFGSETE